MNRTCRNCKWWGKYMDNVCDKTDHIETSEGRQMFSIEAHASDDQGLEAYLVTGPEFGCIHFEQK